ncbi:hypothetical protein ES703_20863 [subsurface metagenome]
MAESASLAELHKMALGQLGSKPAWLYCVFEDARAICSELLKFDGYRRTIFGKLGQQVTLKDHFLPGVLADVNHLRNGNLARSVFGGILVHDYL